MAAEAQQRHLRGLIEDYFIGTTCGAEGAPGQQQTGGSPKAAGAGGEGASGGGQAAAAAAGEDMEDVDEFSLYEDTSLVVSPVQRPATDTLARQLRIILAQEAGRVVSAGKEKFTGLALARIAAGLSSPAFPMDSWKSCGDWGRLGAVDFRLLLEVANREVAHFWERQDEQEVCGH
jgi:hypothetical protein